MNRVWSSNWLAILTSIGAVLSSLPVHGADQASPVHRIGVLAYQTVRRHNEIGIRLALGAARGEIMKLALKEAAVLVLAGLGIGLVGFLALGRSAASLLFEISPWDPLQLGGAAIALSAAAAIGSIIPARHASRLDPMDALRDE